MRKLSRGSVLVYTLLVLMVLLVSGMALATVVLVQQRGAIGTGSSLNAFQAANEGFEDLIARYKNNPEGKLTNLGNCIDTTGVATVTGSGTNVRAYTATFTKNGGTPVSSCDDLLSTIDQVKVVATVGPSTRAIETAFGASQHFGWVKINNDNTLKNGIQGYYIFSPTDSNSNHHSPEQICKDAGYDTFTGACKTIQPKTANAAGMIAPIQGTLNAIFNVNTSWVNQWIMSCQGWRYDSPPTFYSHFDITDNSQILCGR